MEMLKTVSLALGLSLAMAASVTLLVSWGMDSLERLRQRWVTREGENVRILHA